MKIVDNYESKIWLGLRAGYTHKFFNKGDVLSTLKKWCNEKKQCISITDTEFIYIDGWEPGLIIGFINYPRFPLSQAELRNRTIELGELLMKKFKQYRISLTFYPSVPGGTMMLENEELT